ncbi:hypothetical protein D3C73_1135050 [compost metagenome]
MHVRIFDCPLQLSFNLRGKGLGQLQITATLISFLTAAAQAPGQHAGGITVLQPFQSLHFPANPAHTFQLQFTGYAAVQLLYESPGLPGMLCSRFQDHKKIHHCRICSVSKRIDSFPVRGRFPAELVKSQIQQVPAFLAL